MDTLTAQQEQIGNSIVKLFEAVKKEPTSRRTAENLKKRETEVNRLWEQFITNHNAILALGEPEHEYFKKHYYAQVEQTKEAINEKLISYAIALGKLNSEPTKADDALQKDGDRGHNKPSENDELHGKLNKENMNLNLNPNLINMKRAQIRIMSFEKQLDTIVINKEMSNAAIEFQANNLVDEWKKIDVIREEVLLFDNFDDKNTKEMFIGHVDKLQKKYSETVISLKEMKHHESISASEHDVKLPRMQIPVFEGRFNTWIEFHDIFDQVIHRNKRLSNVEKMQYLKNSLRSEAAKLLSHLEVSNDNYKISWDLIKERYNNKRKLLSAYLNTLSNQPKLEFESSTCLKRFHDTTKECLHGIECIGISTVSWDPIILHQLIQKLDNESRKLYEQSVPNSKEIPTVEHFYSFLKTRFESLEAFGENNRQKKKSPLQSSIRNYMSTTEPKCGYCQKMHSIYNCNAFLALSIQNRQDAIRRLKLCRNCLNHPLNENCHSRRTCSKCQRQHHTLIHLESARPIRVQNTVADQSTDVLLATAVVKVTSVNGKQELLRALIDTGSQGSFITENAAQLLSLPRTRTYAKVSGLGATNAATSLGKMHLEIQPQFPSTFKVNIEAFILTKLTKQLPNTHFNQSIPWKDCVLADQTFNKPGPIDLIIGADVYTSIIRKGLRKTTDGMLAQDTELGWIISGKLSLPQNQIKIVSMISKLDLNRLDKQLRQFWEIEEPQRETVIKCSDNICEQHYKENHKRNKDGTYTVRIPFKANKKTLGDSKKRATARLLQLEKRLKADTNLAKEYRRFMSEYLALGHMKLIKPRSTKEEIYYMPHQAVIKEDSSTTKLRVVFDASSKTNNGISLNDNMHVGPRLQEDLSTIILRWRKYRYVFTADIEKMYRQIKVDDRDQNYQRILWRFSPNEPIQEYALSTVTYGTASAPFLAIRTLKQLAQDESTKYSKASKVLARDFYVDDMMTGADTLDQAKIMQRELCHITNAGGFTLRKWTSNNQCLLKTIPEDRREKGILEISDNESIKALGIHWSPRKDEFQIKVRTTPLDTKLTKRMLLSDIARIFDPLGWATPVIITAKLMMQELWKQELSWDDPLPDKLTQIWKKFIDSLPSLQQITIPRWIQTSPDCLKMELYGFCDASEKAFAAVIYSKVVSKEGNVFIRLLTAKSKVAPIKPEKTIPKLELCAAVLLAKLMTKTINALDTTISSVKLWSDSQIVLAWIKGDPNKKEIFVANRVAEIHEMTRPKEWNYVKTTENPADCASRGIQPHELKDLSIWWNGPAWLSQTESDEYTLVTTTVTKERCIQIEPQDTYVIERFSSFRRLLRVIAYCNRFTNKCRRATKSYESISLSTDEINFAHIQVVRLAQKVEFDDEIAKLEQFKPLPSRSKILQLMPYLDKNKILRVGGRLEESILPYDEKHPIILPRKSYLTTLIIRDAHERTLHGGNRLTMAFVRRQYWIIDGRNTIRHQIHKCVRCTRNRAKLAEQQMGRLPAFRIVPSRPFTHTGVDYAGPIKIRSSRTRGLSSFKGYIAVFVCMTTKAVHIEAVSDLTTEAFLAAFKRFTARRGLCAHIYSDCGTNFVGAQKSLDADVKKAVLSSEQHVANLIASDGTQWHFNPPGAPHFGGMWEAAVKSIKHHMKRVIGEVTLTFEELTTVLYQIEACLNSRPLCQLTNDSEDYCVLTPGHFLIGTALNSVPGPEEQTKSINLLKRWRLTDKLTRDVWKVWSSEYLHQLQQRTKWKIPFVNIKTGELVLIKDENLPPTKWLLGRITKTHSGPDNKVRVVDVRCKGNTILTRPITKICKLPMEESEPTEVHNTIAHINAHLSYRETNKVLNINQKQPSRKRKINPVTGYSNLVKTRKQPKLTESCSTSETHSITTKRLTLSEYHKRRYEQGKTLLFMLLLLLCCKLGKTEYNISHPPAGLYIEHMGEAKVQQGTLRVEVSYAINITRDRNNIDGIVSKMVETCNKAKRYEEEIHCSMLISHLHEKQIILRRNLETLQESQIVRKKRGLFGNILQDIFGVNNEVYADLNALQQNQHSLLQANQHQTTLMLTTTAQIRDVESTTNLKLQKINEKLNQVTTELNKAEGWFQEININRVDVQILTAYNIALGLLEELESKYDTLIMITLQRAEMLKSITPGELMSILQTASKNLPPTVKILPKPHNRMLTKRNETHIIAQWFLPLITSATFNIVKITPIPHKIYNNSYIIPVITNSIIATDYNSQTYFELSEREFLQCTNQETHQFICAPTVISRIDTNPNCIIDEIYQRHEKIACEYTEIKIAGIVFKHVYQMNTWLFIAKERITAAVICNGIHQDIEFRDVGIIQISNGCIIKTKQNVLTAEIRDAITVKASYNQPLDFNVTQIKLIDRPTISLLHHEAILKSADHFSTIIQEENNMQNIQLQTWKTVSHHAITGSLTLTITAVGIYAIFKCRPRKMHNITKPRSQEAQPKIPLKAALPEVAPRRFELSKLSSPSEGPQNVCTT